LHARVEVVTDAGHYPHAQQPDVVNALLVDFLQGLTHHA
jgi:pimeloyl-ACP methyl ester carboxylesterase